jgi:Ca2+-binding EF-hand superfamily protein
MWAKNFQNKAKREKEHSATFKKLDTDHSGKLSLSEAKAGIKKWADANKVKISKDDFTAIEGIFFNNAGPKGELTLEQYIEYNEEVKEKMHRLFWKERIHKMWQAADGDGNGHITWDDAKMELEAWAGDNGVRIESENLAKGDLID